MHWHLKTVCRMLPVQVLHPMAQMGMAGYHPMYMPQPYFAPAGMSPPGMAAMPVRPLLHSQSYPCLCFTEGPAVWCSSPLHSRWQSRGWCTSSSDTY